MKLSIGSDHAGIRLKKLIIEHFTDIEFQDEGTFSEESTDYPDWISKVGYSVQNGDSERGIVICGTGIGASIVANKIKGVRAALCFNSLMAEMSRRHNNANILALGARILGDDLAINIVETWLNTSFDGGRHQRRIDKITGIEESHDRG
jgi:ribose 5-phosphate isomerase B